MGVTGAAAPEPPLRPGRPRPQTPDGLSLPSGALRPTSGRAPLDRDAGRRGDRRRRAAGLERDRALR
ncbi:hypothetical protein DVZ84_20770 [Streptomyces parvulus]|uniref:Uncharacterized protein n=1 Tax=Streptomyces parvulus TaxID=146923 RepID=A0A369V391_9ACTN|nr:hypothetical protein DVZ84_20770 [Streptomyces parvulus]